MRTVALVSCAKSKLREPSQAKDLYDSPLFRHSRNYAERNADRWYVLSALHGLVDPETVIAPYEMTLKGASRKEQRRWAHLVFDQMENERLLDGETRLLWLAGQDYKRELSLLLLDTPSLDPLNGMALGVRMRWLAQQR